MTLRWIMVAAAALLALASTPEALAQSVTLDLGDESGSVTSRIFQLMLLITVLSLAPGILVMTTAFTRIVVVLAFLRTALGLQTTPPNSVLVSLAMFLTLFVMAPVFEQSYEQGIRPLLDGEVSEMEGIRLAAQPVHAFMRAHVREKDLLLFVDMADVELGDDPEAIPYRVLIPAFMISELRRAFEIGFLIYLPFLIIDMVVASILMSMGMMMLPPVMIALPFKLIFFVLVDGWFLVVGSLVESYASAAAIGGG